MAFAKMVPSQSDELFFVVVLMMVVMTMMRSMVTHCPQHPPKK